LTDAREALPNATPQPEMEPFKIYEDDRVCVSLSLVYHAPIWPAFAYRFDTDERAVVFCGAQLRYRVSRPFLKKGPELARSGRSAMSAFAPLLGVERTLERSDRAPRFYEYTAQEQLYRGNAPLSACTLV